MSLTSEHRSVETSGFRATRADVTASVENGNILVGQGTLITYDHGRFLISSRPSPGGPTSLPRELDRKEMEALLASLRKELDDPPPTIDVTALDAFVHLLSRTLKTETSHLFDNARFADIAKDASGAIVGHMGIGIDTLGTIHDAAGVITFSLQSFRLPPGPFRPLSKADRASLITALDRYVDSAKPPADPLWVQVLEDLRRESMQGCCGAWEAWQDRMPGTKPTLHVQGSCVFPTPGYNVELRRVKPQGINPADLLLELVVEPPSDPQPAVLDEQQVTYQEKTSFKYETVTILDVAAGIPVKQIS